MAAALSAARPLALGALAGLGLATLLALADLAPGLDALAFGRAHSAASLHAFLLPALAAFTLHAAETVLRRPVDPGRARLLAALWPGGGAALALALAVEAALPAWAGRALVVAAGLAVLAAAGLAAGMLLGSLPRRSESVTDVARDPLTKGDDASAAHLRFAQLFLPLGALLALVALAWPELWEPRRLHLAGTHVLAAHALVSCYGLAHLWVPRLSGVPAIAAGAIKGELHSTLLGLALLLAGFLSGLRGLLIAGGAFAFLGAFTFMGVIGANIMRNKSRTQRVTPEFAYIPWAFTAVFWLLSGVLLGIFLNVVPPGFTPSQASLAFIHVHVALLGGVAQLLLALAWRLVPAHRGAAPPPFHGAARAGFFALNGGLALLLAGHVASGGAPLRDPGLFAAGALLVALGLGASFFILARHGRGREPR